MGGAGGAYLARTSSLEYDCHRLSGVHSVAGGTSYPDLPDPIEGPSAWLGSNLASPDAWIYRLSPAEVAEIEAAVGDVIRRQIPIVDIGQNEFALPTLAAGLENIQAEVVNGRGFVVMRGLPVERYSMEQTAAAYWGLGTHFGRAVSQNAKGHRLGHVKDIGHDPANPHHRVYATSARHRFHTDSCDIVALLCVKQAKAGGLSSIASSVTIYNEMVRQRPDLAWELFQPLCVDRKGEIPEGKESYYEMAVFHYYASLLTTIYARDFIETAQRFPEVPRLTPRQVEAMDLLDALAASDAIRLDMKLAPGDIQFLHNHQILHARTAFEDYPEPERKRHLLRLWLSPPNGRPLPPIFAERYGTVEVEGGRGGIRVPGADPHVPLVAE